MSQVHEKMKAQDVLRPRTSCATPTVCIHTTQSEYRALISPAVFRRQSLCFK